MTDGPIAKRFVALCFGLAWLCAAIVPTGDVEARNPPVETIGSYRIQMSDPGRLDPVHGEFQREWNIEILYPARPVHGWAFDPYIDLRLDAELKRQHYFDQSDSTIDSWAHLGSGVVPGAVPLPGRHSLVLLSPGLGLVARNYLGLARQLCAQGFVTVLIDHPYIGVTMLKDGRVLRTEDDRLLSFDDANLEKMRPRLIEWRRDLTFVLDQLLSKKIPLPPIEIDRKRIAAVGHSIGGTIDLDACRYDRRIKVCVDLEGAPQGSDFSRVGGIAPTLIVLSRTKHSDAELIAIGKNRKDYDDRSKRFLAEGLRVLGLGSAPGWHAMISGGAHLSVSDAPETMPTAMTRFGGEFMSPARARTVYSKLTLAFLAAFLPKGDASSFRKALAGTPEVQLRKVR